MKRLSFLVSLTNNDNDYQQEQATAAEKAARRLGIDVKIIHANNDAVAQSQQLLHYVQDSSVARPDAILFEPAGGTAFPQVARAAVAAGIGWVVLNHDVDYVMELRRSYKAPICAISSDHEEIGKIQGKQFEALLPDGGTVLYIEGPANSSAAKERTRGMNKTKPANIQVKSMRANWTEESAYRAVSSWLRLQTSQKTHLDLVGAQDDSMAIGARKAFGEVMGSERERRLKLPFTGCDGMPKTGQTWVRGGFLAATIYIRPNTDLALEMLVDAMKNGTPLPDRKITEPESMPSLAELAAAAQKKKGAGA
ncbi:MAG TPA: sugar ABC transporter substrate-binding protein [Candidatus Acidoferrum sp.]|jgi:ABC-type sugar transport system substrate-binding protein|nr:sugar ABC transporter substrate-binding protein [Candidatus Acidoferrum sp.]